MAEPSENGRANALRHLKAERWLSCLSPPAPTPGGSIIGCRGRQISSSFVADCGLVGQTLQHHSPRCWRSTRLIGLPRYACDAATALLGGVTRERAAMR